MKPKIIVVVLGVCGSVLPFTSAEVSAPLPKFKGSEEWKQKRTLDGSAQARSGGEIFFTGKLYQTESGTYSFQFRDYDAETARWNANDPSGFPDGANNCVYAPTPVFQIDPTGLDTVSVTGVPQSGSSGSTFSIVVDQAAHQVGSNIQANMQVHWTISGNLSGWVVQHVQFDYNSIFNDADDSHYSVPSPPTASYWEAWQVTNGTVQYGGSDIFNTRIFPSSTHGSVSITGKVDFYQTSAISSNSPSGWGSVTEAGILLATTSQPS